MFFIFFPANNDNENELACQSAAIFFEKNLNFVFANSLFADFDLVIAECNFNTANFRDRQEGHNLAGVC